MRVKTTRVKKGNKKLHDLSVPRTNNFTLGSGAVVHNCSGWSLYDLILEGFNAPGGCNSGPPKHFDTVLSQAINFIGTLQNEWAEA